MTGWHSGKEKKGMSGLKEKGETPLGEHGALKVETRRLESGTPSNGAIFKRGQKRQRVGWGKRMLKKVRRLHCKEGPRKRDDSCEETKRNLCWGGNNEKKKDDQSNNRTSVRKKGRPLPAT